MISDKYIYQILEIVYTNSDVRKLVSQGLNYEQISLYTGVAIEEGFLEFHNKILRLTEKGQQRLESDAPQFRSKNKRDWILPEEKSRSRRIDKNDIFVPNQNELSF